MTILRIVTDVHVSDFPSDEDIAQVTQSTKTYVHGVVTSLQMTGDEPVVDRGGHVHASSEDELCYACRSLSRDQLS